MAQDGAGLHAGEGAAHEMQVGAADCRGRQADDRVGRLLHLGVRDVVEAYVADAVPNDCFHGLGSFAVAAEA